MRQWIRKFSRAIFLTVMSAVLIVSAGCGDDDEAVEITMPADAGSAMSAETEKTPVDVYWDATVSMQGYAMLSEGNFYRTLPDELGDLTSSMGETKFYRFGKEIQPLEGRDYRKFSDPSIYTETITAVQNVVEKADASHLSIVVTDLFESDADWSGVTKQLKDKYFSQHLAVAIIGVKNPFKGDIFDVGLDARKYSYDSGNDPKKYRPFYLFIMGPDEAVENFISRWQERQAGVSNEMQYLVFSENLTEQPQDFRQLKLDSSTNLYADDKLNIQDKRIQEYGVDSFGDETSLTTTFNYTPATGSMPIDLNGLQTSTKVYSLEDGEWQPVDMSDSDMKAEITPAETQNNYTIKLTFTPEKSLKPEKINFVHLSVAPDSKAYQLPDWVKQWNMANIDVDPNQFDGSKTINFLHIAESLKESVLSSAHPALVNLDFVVDAR